MNNIAVITGANGMDAKTLTHFLLKKGYKVILTYRRNTYFDVAKFSAIFTEDLKNNPQSELYFDVCDISCQNSVKECIKSVLKNHSRIDEFYHLAADSHVGESFKHKDGVMLINGQSHYYFLESLRMLSPRTRYYGAMTSELIGGHSGIYNEEHQWHPRSPYAIAKEAGARWIDFYKESTDINAFACYGILGNHSNYYRSKDFVIRKITNAAARIALGKQSELRLAQLEWARDEHWSDFGCEIMWKMLQLDKPQNFVIGNGQTHWGKEYVELAFNHFNLDWNRFVVFDTSLIRPNEVVKLEADSTKAQKILGWIPNRMPFKDHIDLMCEYDYQLEAGQTPTRKDVFSIY